MVGAAVGAVVVGAREAVGSAVGWKVRFADILLGDATWLEFLYGPLRYVVVVVVVVVVTLFFLINGEPGTKTIATTRSATIAPVEQSG